MPTVTVFVIAASAEASVRALESVRGQTFDDWECVVVGMEQLDKSGGGASRRVRSSRTMGTWQAGLNNELDQLRADYFLVLPAGSTLRPGALQDLVAEARTSGADAVYGRFRFDSPLGGLPIDGGGGLPGVLGSRQWERSKCVPLAAQLFWRESIGEERFDPEAGDAADWEWCIRVARRGVRWRRSESVVADVGLRTLPRAGEVLESVRAYVRAGTRVAVGAGVEDVTAGEPRGMLAEAERRIASLVELQSKKDARLRAGMACPWHFTQWWHRLGYVGNGPEHLLTENPTAAPERLVELRERPPIDIFVASYKRPDRLTAMIESVRATGYPARVLVAAGDLETVRVCEALGEGVECVYSTAANRRTGCTAPLNHVARSLVRNDCLFCTDDCVFAPDSLETGVRSLYTAYPDSDGVVGLAQENIPDGYLLAFPLIGRRFRERFTRGGGELFFPGYYHMYNDAELGITIGMLGRWHFEARAKLRHFHPCTGVAEDATHTRGRTFGGQDARLWHERRMMGRVWGIDD